MHKNLVYETLDFSCIKDDVLYFLDFSRQHLYKYGLEMESFFYNLHHTGYKVKVLNSSLQDDTLYVCGAYTKYCLYDG